MGFFEAVGACFAKFATFSGRASRSEYWFFHLFSFLLVIVTAGFAFFVLFLPLLAVNARRLHDVDRSGWWMLIAVIPFVGAIVLLVWHCTVGTAGNNRFGTDPLTEILQRHLGAAPVPVGEKTEQLAKIKALLDSGAITMAEFNRMKSEILAS
jgi:uncharacterized membrane protein YhaH (DUF805 family)